MDDKPKDALDIGKMGPVLKQVYGGKKKKKKEEESRFSKIRNILKKRKKNR